MDCVEGAEDVRSEDVVCSKDQAVQPSLRGEVRVQPVTLHLRILEEDRKVALLNYLETDRIGWDPNIHPVCFLVEVGKSGHGDCSDYEGEEDGGFGPAGHSYPVSVENTIYRFCHTLPQQL